MNEVDAALAANLFLLSQLVERVLPPGDIWQFEGLVDGQDYRGAYDFLEQQLGGRANELSAEARAVMSDVAEQLAAADF
jgi:hypothetical protein